MASSNTEFSQMLQHITDAKLDELSNKRKIFLSHKAATLEKAQALNSAIDKLHALSNGVKLCFGIPVADVCMIRDRSGAGNIEIALANLDRFLKQAQYDPSISPDILDRWQKSLVEYLDIQTVKYEYATLFAQLTMEWLSASKSHPLSDQDVTMSDDFGEAGGSEKIDSRKRWEESVFTSVERDPDTITNFLEELFKGTVDNLGQDIAEGWDNTRNVGKALQSLRKRVSAFENSLASPSQFNTATLSWVITGLVQSDLLTEQKRAVLRDFQNNYIILKELADVLNMRLAALHAWSWGTEVPVEQRRHINGSYQICVQEDLIQAIFLQYLGVRWSVMFKEAFTDFKKTKNVWKSPRAKISAIDKKRRQFFLDCRRDKPNIQITKERIYQRGYFVSQLLNHEQQARRCEEGEEEADFATFAAEPVLKKKKVKVAMAGKRARKAPSYFEEKLGVDSDDEASGEGSAGGQFDDYHDPDEYYDDSFANSVMDPPNQMQARQNLLLLLSADILIGTRIHGAVTCFRSQYESWNPNLPHTAILTVLSFLGVSKKWTSFFERFLRAPLKFVDDNNHAEPRFRQRGTPESHVLSEVFGETILFCLDFLVNKETDGQLLWRVHDDLWFWSSDEQACVKAWQAIEKFNEIMGVSLSTAKTGSAQITPDKTSTARENSPVLPSGQIRWGMLYLNPESGRFEIDQEMVDHHIEELRRQLQDKKKSIFGWIQAWNSYATTFFTSNFGKPVNCFGREHVDMMLQTHERIQRQIFSLEADGGKHDRSVITYLRDTISSRFGISSIPDGFFFLPIDLGGLELSSSFINLVGLRDSVIGNPETLLDEFFEAERDNYTLLKQRFDAADKERKVALNQGFCPPDGDQFMSFDEYIRYRELLDYNFSGQLVEVYDKLLQRPTQEFIECDHHGPVFRAVSELDGQNSLTGIKPSWGEMNSYWRWVAQLYGPEIIDRFGGFNIVDPGLLPIGLVGLFRSGRVNW
ncbi:hypothetical protein P175DRAFT_0503239 [Aspergillus ochraceoroseus IBT 24754]|uniref:Reverse transcriptase domain-containing protein n=2 Tax=Aspergillus ochraceoroseus TaxID=138278 RepID=A0A2T5LTV8_9EURO|nr:uncharacterized protein P175DRAFT_0503239 [Aspergillus ochraceoroseus IBT 24754]KKK15985.1 hypothetical protein AOCH_000952 [Aspergillus ochraceoroseus]PTU19708.1 hypothetical protein P175DRAFT_0503239 [Aspergillus ochraceoroseus IBT 24754]